MEVLESLAPLSDEDLNVVDKSDEDGSKSYSCHVCSRRFSERSNMQRHIRTIHAVDDKAEATSGSHCKICGKHFSHMKSIHKHMKVKHGSKEAYRHNCHVCNKRFAFPYALREHLHTTQHKESIRRLKLRKKQADNDSGVTAVNAKERKIKKNGTAKARENIKEEVEADAVKMTVDEENASSDMELECHETMFDSGTGSTTAESGSSSPPDKAAVAVKEAVNSCQSSEVIPQTSCYPMQSTAVIAQPTVEFTKLADIEGKKDVNDSPFRRQAVNHLATQHNLSQSSSAGHQMTAPEDDDDDEEEEEPRTCVILRSDNMTVSEFPTDDSMPTAPSASSSFIHNTDSNSSSAAAAAANVSNDSLLLKVISHGNMSANWQHKCQHCGKLYPSSSMLSKHEAVVHLKTQLPLKCEFCGQLFTFLGNLKKHQMNDHGLGNHFSVGP